MNRRAKKWLRLARIAAITAVAGPLLVAVGIVLYLGREVPDVSVLRDARLQAPLRVYSYDGLLIGEFGEKKRIPLTYDAIPARVIDAFLAAEDDRFFVHAGVDYSGLVRAFLANIRAGGLREGGGTITMQLARNMLLDQRKTYRRKVVEILTAFKIEHALSKREILQLYLNKIFLGQRAYGIGAAAQVYFGKTAAQLTLAEIATLAGLTSSPSRSNPIANSARARDRRNYVLGRMLELGKITHGEYQRAVTSVVLARVHGPAIEVEAPYVAEMVRRQLLRRFGASIYTSGYRALTTIDSQLQQAAVKAVRNNLLAYDRRHRFRGPSAHTELAANGSTKDWVHALRGRSTHAGLTPAVITTISDKEALAFTRAAGRIALSPESLEWAKSGDDTSQLRVGDIVYVAPDDVTGTWSLRQIPRVQGAFVAMRPEDGRILALVGGFDFYSSRFNRAVQARRQPGSALKPFLYSAALEHGYTLATLIEDDPLSFTDRTTADWRPKNADRQYMGHIRFREALVHSRNLASIRILRHLGTDVAIRHLQSFGFPRRYLPRNLTLALGTSLTSPLEMASAYAVLANGGFRVAASFIDFVTDSSGRTVFTQSTPVACPTCESTGPTAQLTIVSTGDAPPPPPAIAPRVISAVNAFLITDILQDVVKRGTGRRASALGRNDIAGKTGTTNDNIDAWFCGYNADIVGVAWVGFDHEQSLGGSEEGSRAALPMWLDFMRTALRDTPEHSLTMPPGVTALRISSRTGLVVSAQHDDSRFELFMNDHLPGSDERASDMSAASVLDSLF